MKKRILEIIIVSLIFILALFLRTYQLGEIPKGIHIDEAGMAYDAFCLGNFGVDRYLNRFPVYLLNYGAGQSALYAYLAAIFVKFLGIQTYVIRIPAVLLNMCAIFAIYFIGRKHIGKKYAVLLLLLATINPWNIMASRWGLDCNLLAPCSIIAMWLLFRADGKWYEYVLAGIGIGITLYTYAISYIILPIFLLSIISYMLYTKKINIKNTIILGCVVFIFALPLMLMILVNNGIISEINSFITIPKLIGFRGSEIGLGNVLENIKCIPSLFSYDGFSYNSIKEFGTVYYFTIPLIVIGLIVEIYKLVINIKNKEFNVGSGILVFFISVFITLLLITKPNINRMNAIYFPFVFFQFSAIKFLFEKTNRKVFYIIAGATVILYGYNFISFTNYYFNEYPEEFKYQAYFEDDLTNAIATVVGRPELNEKKVNILTETHEPYIYTLLVNRPSPYDFNSQKEEDNSWGKYVFNVKEIDEDMVYIIKDDGDFIAKLVQNGFEYFDIGAYKIFYINNK